MCCHFLLPLDGYCYLLYYKLLKLRHYKLLKVDESWWETSGRISLDIGTLIWAITMWRFDKCRLRRAWKSPFKQRNSKWCSVSSLTLIVYSCNQLRLWSDCAFAQADLRLCRLHIPHCWKYRVAAHMVLHSYSGTSITVAWRCLLW